MMSNYHSPVHFFIKLHIYNIQPHFGSGVIKLMANIQSGKSLRNACEEMNLSYSKAWQLINAAEKDLGFEIISRNRGGAAHGGSCLTQDGIRVYQNYLAFENELKESAERLFLKYFGDYTES